MIEATELTKRYGDKTAVDGLSFTVRPGVVTGFLGPNGAGQVDHDADDPRARRARRAGQVLVDGRRYRDLPAPLERVGALLEARSIHPGRSATNHLLRARRRRTASPAARVDEVIDLVGLRQVARKRAGTFSLGMGQRLGIASALLGDPAHARARRAGQRPRPRGHPLDAQPAARARRRGPHDLRLLAPDERDGADRRPPDRRRPRAAARRHADGGLRRAGVTGGRARALAARHAAARAAARRRRDGHAATSRACSRSPG